MKHQHKVEFRNLDDSAVINTYFSGLRTLAASMTSTASTTSVASMTSTASFHQKLMFVSSLAPKWSNPVPFCGMDHQKSIFLLISDTLSVGGCWGQPMSILWKLVDETQISISPEATRHHNSTKLLILLPLRGIYFYSVHYETPCIYGTVMKNAHSEIISTRCVLSENSHRCGQFFTHMFIICNLQVRWNIFYSLDYKDFKIHQRVQRVLALCEFH